MIGEAVLVDASSSAPGSAVVSGRVGGVHRGGVGAGNASQRVRHGT